MIIEFENGCFGNFSTPLKVYRCLVRKADLFIRKFIGDFDLTRKIFNHYIFNGLRIVLIDRELPDVFILAVCQQQRQNENRNIYCRFFSYEYS